MAPLLTMMIKMQEKLNKLEKAADQPDKGKQTFTKIPTATTVDTEAEPISQTQINQQLVQALKVLQGEEEKSTPPPLRVLPKHVCEQILKLHDFPAANYKQQAACHSTKALLQLYERGIPLDAHTPDNFHDIAHSLTESIQDALTSDAFPTNERPLLKERKALLGTVLGKHSITAKELGEAYSSHAPNYANRGRGRSNYHNSNWRCRGRGGGRRGGGRGRNFNSNSNPFTENQSQH